MQTENSRCNWDFLFGFPNPSNTDILRANPPILADSFTFPPQEL
jgi:hypothetical protein